MAVARRPDGPGAALTSGRAFGIDVEATFDIPCVPTVAQNGSVRTRLELTHRDDLARMWMSDGAEMLIDRRLANGRRLMTIERNSAHGFRIWASRFGHHIVAEDGLHIWSALPPVAPWRWQRLLFAQVLPLAAALRGLDPFHASGIVIDRKAFAFVAASGTGKTSVAAHLVADGAGFMTDDVLSLGWDGNDVIAHPGPAMTSVAPAELAAMKQTGRERLGSSIGRERGKRHLRPPVVGDPHRLAAFIVLSRESDGALRLERVSNPDPRLLLSSSFITYVRSSDHLVTHLDTCARIAETVPIYQLSVPRAVSAQDAARFFRERSEDLQ